MNKYKVGSLFAGVGGICQAFKDCSCDVVWANEIDKNSGKTYQLNHKETRLILSDVRDLNKENKEELESVDILTAGFPCQPFSQAGHGKGFEDERGVLFYEVIRLMNELKPKAYLLENVRTLATHNKGRSFEIVRKEIYHSGYSFIPFILNASDYTDIPQGRERIYIVGFRDEPEFYYLKPTKTNSLMNFGNNFLSSSFKIPSETKTQKKHFGTF